MPAPSQSIWIADGEQVEATDLNGIAESASVMAGKSVTAIIGIADAQVDDTPITAVASGMTVIVGALGQAVLVQGRLADYLPATTLPIAAADPSQIRWDLIAFAYADVMVPTGLTANNLDKTTGNITPQPTAFVYRGIRLTVVTGTAGGGLPAAPSGFDPLAQVEVPADATALTPANITILLPTIASQLTKLVGGGVSGVNGKTGAVVIDQGEGISVDNSGGDIKIDNAGVLALNGQTGAQSIVNDSPSIKITPHGESIGIASTALTAITSNNNSLKVTASGTAVDLAVVQVAAPQVVLGQFGAIPLSGPGRTFTVDFTLPAGSWTVLAEFNGYQMASGTVEMHFVGNAAGTTVSGNGTLFDYDYAIGIVVAAGTTQTITVEVTYTNSPSGESNSTVKLLAYPA
jgi:hypothetical protein